MRHPLPSLVALAILPAIGIAADAPGRPRGGRILEAQSTCVTSCLGSPDRLACRCQCLGFTRGTPRLATTYRGCVFLERDCVQGCRRMNRTQAGACMLRCVEQELVCISAYGCPKD